MRLAPTAARPLAPSDPIVQISKAISGLLQSIREAHEFRSRFEALNALSDEELAEKGLERSGLARQVLGQRV